MSFFKILHKIIETVLLIYASESQTKQGRRLPYEAFHTQTLP